MIPKQINTLRQGNIGLAIAISYFAKQGCYISIPLNDIQDYDLVVDFDDGNRPKTVQVKTTRSKPRGKHYKVELMTGRKSFTENRSNIVFIVDGDGTQYLIPRNEITASKGIVLSDNYSKYIV